jgi:hypothetical protein
MCNGKTIDSFYKTKIGECEADELVVPEPELLKTPYMFSPLFCYFILNSKFMKSRPIKLKQMKFYYVALNLWNGIQP